MSLEIANNWLETFRSTALVRDLEGHMAHIARDVGVFGVPGFDVLGYDDWYTQCAHEFPQGLLSDIRYSAPKIRVATADRVMFKAREDTSTSDGGEVSQALEFVLVADAGTWRLKQLRILPAEEAEADGLR